MNNDSKKILQIVSFCGLGLSIVPALLVYGGVMEKQLYLNLLLTGMLLWFGSAIFWIKKDHLG